LKGDIMPKRVYHLTIEYDTETDEIEYIVEGLEETETDIQLTQIAKLDLEKYFDKKDIIKILDNYEVGKA
jgi:asparagine synthetase B (glutamine-hydrolysing)